MKLKFFILIMLVGLSTLLKSQPEKIPYKVGKKWTFCDYNSKKIFKQKWDTVDFYSDGVAWVRKKKKWLLIDINGNKKTKLRFDNVTPFLQQVARVKYKGNYVWLNTKGELLKETPTVILGCGGSHGYDILMYQSYKKNNKIGLIIYTWDSIQKINIIDSLAPKYDAIEDEYGSLIKTKINQQYGLTNVGNGEEVLPHQYDAIIFNTQEIAGSVKALHIIKKNNIIGFLSNRGKLFIEPKYTTATTFLNGLSYVSLPNGNSFYIDYKGFEYYKHE
ncbi:MAG: WG repeat-containing protein [Bacteroidia bacterium]|nr:WG repeat-containing protein [Bacteroidia bacterium]